MPCDDGDCLFFSTNLSLTVIYSGIAFFCNIASVNMATDSVPAAEPQFAHQKTKEERAFVWRLDVFLLTFGCISQSK